VITSRAGAGASADAGAGAVTEVGVTGAADSRDVDGIGVVGVVGGAVRLGNGGGLGTTASAAAPVDGTCVDGTCGDGTCGDAVACGDGGDGSDCGAGDVG
jgi:hypothetical protein